MAFCPEAGFTDQHFHFTERMLLDVLLRTRGTNASGIGGGDPRYDERTPLNIKADLSLVCKVDQAQLRDLPSRHPGHIIQSLFFHKTLEYGKKVCLIAPTDNGASLLPQREGVLEEYEMHRHVLEEFNMQHPDYINTRKEKFPTYLAENIGLPGDHIQPQHPYVLTGTITSNGYEIKPLAYDIRKRAPPPSSLKKLPSKLDDIEYISEDDCDTSALYDPVIVGIDPGLRSPATATILAHENPARVGGMRIKSGPFKAILSKHRRDLNKAKARFAVGDIVAAETSIVPVSCPDMVQGGDLQVFARLHRSVRSHIRSEVQALPLLRRFYGSKTYKVKHWQRKVAWRGEWDAALDNLIEIAERVAREQSPRESPEAQLLQDMASADTGPSFDSDPGSELRLVRDVAQWGEKQERLIIFGLGDGDFTDSRGGQGLNKKFSRMLKVKVKTRHTRPCLGPRVVSVVQKVDEYLTTRTCCVCHHRVDVKGGTVSCPNCNRDWDRDDNGSHNIGWAVQEMVYHGRRPQVLCRPQK